MTLRAYPVRHPDILLSIKLSRFANLYGHKVQFRPLYISYQAFSLHSRCGKEKARLFIRYIIRSDTPDNRSTKFAWVKREA